ncbi:MAG: glycosyltransferase family 4 protein [Elusimicrobiales bacterium]|nr:glycosyltransferase family 4 protein [Elusimicrobiales bacterium]
MMILKFIANPGNNIESYNALYSAVYLTKYENTVVILSNKNTYIEEFCKKNKIKHQPVNFLLKAGLMRIPNADIIEIYGYSKEDEGFIRRLISTRKPKILRILSFPDINFIEFIKEYYNVFSKIIVASQSIKDELLFNQIDLFKILVLSPLLAMPRWESAKQIKPVTFLQRPYRIATVIRDYSEDALKLFLMIAKNVLDKNDKVNFMIVGTKDEKIREFARNLGISPKIDILGWRDDMPEVMAMTHIYVSTKSTPSISRSLIEAMASAVVCVVSDINGNSDFINEYNGIIVKKRNIEEYVKVIHSLLSEPVTMQNISAMAYAYAKANFSADIVSKVEEILYEEVINEWVSNYI